MVTRTLSRHCIFETRRRTSSAATLQIGCFNKRTAAIDARRVNEGLIDLGVLRIHDASLFARRRVLHESASDIYPNPFKQRSHPFCHVGVVVHPAGSTLPDARWFDAQSARPPRTDGPAAPASNQLRAAGRLPWPAQSPDPRGEGEHRGGRDELPRPDGGYGTAWRAGAGSRQPRRQRPARRLQCRSEKFEPSQVSEQTGPGSPQRRVPTAASMSGKPLVTSANTRFVRRSQSCQTLYVGPPHAHGSNLCRHRWVGSGLVAALNPGEGVIEMHRVGQGHLHGLPIVSLPGSGQVCEEALHG